MKTLSTERYPAKFPGYEFKLHNSQIFILEDAFHLNGDWLPFFYMRLSRFEFEKIKLIHDAKTISVVKTGLQIQDNFDWSDDMLFRLMKFTFSRGRRFQLSDLVDLSNLNCFVSSTEFIKQAYLLPPAEHPSTHLVSSGEHDGFGTLNLTDNSTLGKKTA